MTDKPDTKTQEVSDDELLGLEPSSPKSKFEIVDGRRVYTTATGYRVTILGISPLLIQRVGDAYRKKHPEPQPPTYIAETAGGGQEVNYHDETTLETAEDHRAFDEYKEAHREWRKAEQSAMVRAVAIKGVKYDMPDDDEWIESQKLIGLGDDIPEDKLELKIYFFETEVVGSVEDMITLLGGAMGIGGLQGQALESALQMFPTSV